MNEHSPVVAHGSTIVCKTCGVRWPCLAKQEQIRCRALVLTEKGRAAAQEAV